MSRQNGFVNEPTSSTIPKQKISSSSSEDDQVINTNRRHQSQSQQLHREQKSMPVNQSQKRQKTTKSVLNLEETSNSKESSAALDHLIKELQIADSHLQQQIKATQAKLELRKIAETTLSKRGQLENPESVISSSQSDESSYVSIITGGRSSANTNTILKRRNVNNM